MKFPAFEPINFQRNENSSIDSLIDIPICEIFPDADQPRKIFDDASLEELAMSIKSHGIIQPIIVRKKQDGSGYQIISGERRWHAAMKAGLKKIPAIVKEYDGLEKKAVALVENIQRKDLNPLEEAQAIQDLLSAHALTHQQVAESIGKSRTTISNVLRLLSLESEVKELVYSELIEMGHAKALLALKGVAQLKAAEEIIIKNMTVRDSEKYIKNLLSVKKARDFDLEDKDNVSIAYKWNEQLSQTLSTQTRIHINNLGKGKIIINFESFGMAEKLIKYIIED